ncbi:MAG: hypothetical protein D6731_24505 [Planctomycetota bacterium]|nr:MAG: hypothetical protein D6731_24505 [Planctomycetota bacterium]
MDAELRRLLAALPADERAAARHAVARGWLPVEDLRARLRQRPPGASFLPSLRALPLGAPQLEELGRVLEAERRRLGGAPSSWVGPRAVDEAAPSAAHGGSAADSSPTLVAPGDSPSPATERRGAPARLGPYLVEEELARGGMGVVYRARHRDLGRAVALKLLPLGAGAEQAERFAIEAQAAARLDHPNIVRVYDVGRAAGQSFLAMELVEGESLKERLARGPLDVREAADIALRLARAVAYAHSRAILHRDIKPANVLLDARGEPRLSDFGLAKEVGAGSRGLTVTGQAVGTPAYMPPEQADGNLEAIDRRADVYSLGATLYCLLTGQPPFAGNSALGVIKKVLTEEARPPSRSRPGIPRDLDTIVLTCLQKEPEARYPTASALAEDLERFLAGEPIRARPLGSFERMARWAFRRRRAVALGALGALLLGSLGLGVLFVEQRRRLALQRARAEAERARAEAERTRAEAAARQEREEKAARRALALANRLRRAEIALERGYAALGAGRGEEAADRFALAWTAVDGVRGTEALASLGEERAAQLREGLLSPEDLRAAAALGLREALGRWRRQEIGTSPPRGLASAALSADGRVAFLLAEDGLEAWDAEAAQPRRLWRQPAAAGAQDVLCVGGAEGVLLCALPRAGGGGAVRALDPRDGAVRWELALPFAGRLVASPDGTLLALVDPGPQGRVWVHRLGDRARVFACEARQRPGAAYPSSATAAAFGGDGAVLAVGYGDGTFSLWALGEGLRGRASPPCNAHPGGAVTALAFPREEVRGGRFLLLSAGEDGRVVAWEQTPRRFLAVRVLLEGAEPIRCGVLASAGPFRARFAVGTARGGVRVWQLVAGTIGEEASLRTGNGTVRRCALSPAGDRLLAVSSGEGAKLWTLGELEVERGTGPLAFAPGGRRAWVALRWDPGEGHGQGRHEGFLVLRSDRGRGGQVHPLGHARPWSMAFLDEDTLVWTIDRDYRERTPPVEAPERAARYAVERYSLRERAVLWSRPLPLAFSLAISPDGERLAVGTWSRARSEGAELLLLGVERGEVLRRLAWHGRTVRRALFLPDGGLLSAADDGALARWGPEGTAPRWAREAVAARSLPAREAAPTPTPEEQERVGVAWIEASTDGAYVLSADRSGGLRRWRIEDGAPAPLAHPPPAAAGALVFAAPAGPGTWVLVEEGGSLRLVDERLGRSLRRAKVPARVEFCAIDPERRTLAVATSRQTVYFWRLSVPVLPDLEEAARRRARSGAAR